jgi:hypothetical protein
MTTNDVDRVAAYAIGQLSNRIRDLRLSFRGNGLVLSGHCETYHLKHLAQELIMKVTGAPLIANEIEVEHRMENQDGPVFGSNDSLDSGTHDMTWGPAAG